MSVTATATPKSRILVVDDEVGPRESLRMLLNRTYQIKTAETGRVALEEIPKFQPDLVICDIKMAEMDGLEVLRRVKELDPTIEVVMITAYASLDTVKSALTHGAFEYLIKPFARQDLEDVVGRALRRRQTDLGRKDEVAMLVDEMRALSTKTRELEEAARREAAEQSLRLTQLAILRAISRRIVTELDRDALIGAITALLEHALQYDHVAIVTGEAPPAEAPSVLACPIRDAEGTLGALVVDNRASQRTIDPPERELLEMLAEYLAIALRNARLYGEIAETKRSLEQLIAFAGDAIVTVDAADRIAGWNPAAERIFGLAPSEAMGRPITELLLAAEYESARSKLVDGSPMHVFETRAAGDRTPPVALAVTLSALPTRAGQLHGLIAIVRDVTLQREIETQLQQSEKLTALGQLAGGIAHDFNNLLQAILGYAQLMKAHATNLDLVRRSLDVVESAALDGSETVRRIQQFARLRPDEPFMLVDLRQIAEDAVAITKPRREERSVRENHPMRVSLGLDAVAPINGRPAALTEMLTNLVLNAVDAMPTGGELSIATTNGPGDTVALTVSDTGVGMSDEIRRRIFEPFFSTKGEAGSGLGLSMAYSIVKRHGGDIRVDSEPGRGTTFTIVFPVAAEPRPATRASAAPPERRHARVLVVDDDPQVLSALGDFLRNGGHSVYPATGGAAGLLSFSTNAVDIVLSNVGMAGMNGWQFVQRIREKDADVPVLFITGWGLREEDYGRLAALNVQGCLFKPVGPDDLDSAIQNALSVTAARAAG